MKGDNNMPTVLPKENEVEQFFSRIMASLIVLLLPELLH